MTDSFINHGPGVGDEAPEIGFSKSPLCEVKLVGGSCDSPKPNTIGRHSSFNQAFIQS